jgi:hypothetical protein
MLNWVELQVRAMLAHLPNERGQSELLIVLLLVFLIFVLTMGHRTALQ